MEKFFYLGQILGTINTIGGIIALVVIAAIVIAAIFYFSVCDDDENEYKPIIVKSLKSFIIGVVASLVTALVPSKQTWYLMKGGEIVDTLNEGGRISKTAEKTLDLINSYLDEQLERMKE